MPKFIVTAPDGSKYEVNAPDGATEMDAIDYVRKNPAVGPNAKAAEGPWTPYQRASSEGPWTPYQKQSGGRPLMNVEMPDGTIIEGVPEGTSKAEILSKWHRAGGDIRSLKAPKGGFVLLPDDENSPKAPKGGFVLLPDEERSGGDKLMRGTGLAARAVASGATAIPSVLGDALNTALNYGIRGVNKMGASVPELGMPSEVIQRRLSDAGLPRPETSGERVAGDVLGAATGAGGAAKLFANLADKVGPGVAQKVMETLGMGPGMQTLSAGAGATAGGVTRESGGGPGAELLASFLAALAPGAASSAGSAAVRGTVRGGEAGRQRYVDRLQAFEDAGTTPSVGQASGNRVMQQVESGLANVSSSAGVMDRAAEREAREIGAKVERLANERVPNANATKAGLSVERGLKNFVQRFRDEQDFLYEKLDRYIPPYTPVPASNVLQKIAGLTKPIAGAEATSSLIQTPRMSAIGGALANDTAATPAQNILSSILGADGRPIVTGQTLARPGGIPYLALKELRSAIGAKITNPSLTDDIPTGQWKQIYGALSDDMASAAEQAGPEAVKAFNRANAFTRAGHDRIETILDRVSGKDTAEKVFQAAVNPTEMREGGTTVRTVMKSLNPEERDIVTGAVVKRMGLASPSNQNELGEQFSSQTFLTNWNKVSPEAKASLFSDPEMRGNLDQIAKAANIIRQGSKVFANPSGTSPAINNQVTGFTVAGSLLTGHFGVTAGIATLLGAANLSARLMTNPSFVKWLAKSTTMPPSMIPTQVNMLSNYAARHWPERDRAELNRYLGDVKDSYLNAQGGR